jgi:nucleoside-diphosphate-sugar epimerase
MHVILGAGGAISQSLAEALKEKKESIRFVSRRGIPSPDGESVAADLTDSAALRAVLKGAQTAYLLVGFPYKTSVWQQQWPALMREVVSACSETGCPLVFLDNIYMLSDQCMPRMTESCSIQPSSQKGKVRAEVDHILLEAASAGTIQACIARSADFYGYMQPYKSLLLDLVIRKMVAGKKPQWFYTVDKKHSFSYVPDIGRALAILGTSEASWNQVWNVPTAPAMTLAEIIDMINRIQGSSLKPMVTNEFLTSILRLFIPALAEMKELKYQLVQDYVLPSAKFEHAFSFKPTSMEDGLRKTLLHIKTNG